MERAATPVARPRAIAATPGFDRRALGAWMLGFAPVLYLALRGGGYDQIVYSEVGLAAWWIVLLGVPAGTLPLSGFRRPAWVCVGLLGAFALWTGIATEWSSSAELTVAELGRVATYLGFFVLGLCVVRRDTLRQLVTGVGVAFGVVSLLAVLSRLDPAAFPADQIPVFFPGATTRLSYPLNYADGTGEFLAIGIPLLLLIATRARALVGQAIATAALPVAVLGIVLTASRGGVLTAVVAIVAFYALAPDRLPKVATGLVAAAGSAILTAGLLDRSALREGLSTQLAVSQRHQLAVLIVIVCVGVALAQTGIGLVTRYATRPPSLQVTRRRATQLTLAALVLVLVIAVAAGVPGQLAHQWDVFKQTGVTGATPGNVYSRLGTVAGSHRYQYWRTAIAAFDSKPLTGIGPGTFEFYWAQHGSISEFIINAHSLYLETLADSGLVGIVLLGTFVLVLLGASITRTLRAPPPGRASLAAATASLIAFFAAAGYDWVWQLPAVPVVAMLLGAAVIAYQDEPGAGMRAVPRTLVGGLALTALVAIAIPFAATWAVRLSEADARARKYDAALGDAATAQRLEPYAATPRLQRALVLEAAGDLPDAAVAIAQATARAPSDWQLWLVRSRIDAEDHQPVSAVRDYQRAHALNPRSSATSL